MPAFSFYSRHELEESYEIIRLYKPDLAELIAEANQLIKDGPRYAVWARQVTAPKKWFWQEDKLVLQIDLLFGEIDESCEMQVLNFEAASFESVLMGFISGYNTAERDASTPKESWDKFIKRLNEVDVADAKNFIGSIERYKKIFLDANK